MIDNIRLIDSHVHVHHLDEIENIERIRKRVGADRMNIACIIDRELVNYNPIALAAKAAYPGKFYVFAGLDHTSRITSGTFATPSLAEQVDLMIALGADGIKMLESKPDERKQFDIPLDGEYYAGLFARLEESRFPLLWHVADPAEFWDPATTPAWALDNGWGYNDTFIAKEQLHSEVWNVLERHPNLKVIFAHFHFISSDLPRASALLDRFQGVHLDLAPGIELLYELSEDSQQARAFFEKYANRIILGTDIMGDQEPDEANTRLGVLRRWLETDDEFRVPSDADFLMGPPEDGLIRGMALSQEALEEIYHTNFERLVGSEPRELVRDLAAKECQRLAASAFALSGNESARVMVMKAAERILAF